MGILPQLNYPMSFYRIKAKELMKVSKKKVAKHLQLFTFNL